MVGIKSRFECEGYKVSYNRANQGKRRALAIAPQQSRPILPVTAKASLVQFPGQGRFQSDIDGHCFHIFLQESAVDICGAFPSSLWDRLIPQISETEPFVRHAVLAIGALARHSKAQLHLPAPGSSVPGPDFQYALKQYGKSLQGMREAIAGGQHNLRKALIACLLIFCFEGMLGNQTSAAAHAESGGMLLVQHFMRKPQKTIGWPAEEAWELQPNEVEILIAFNSLDLQVLLFLDHRDKRLHRQIVENSNATLKTQPTVFETLHEARRFWQVVMNRNFHFLKSLQAVDIKNIQEARTATPWEDSANFQVNELLLSDPAGETPSLKQDVARYQADIESWRASSKPLFDTIMAGNEERQKVAVAILGVQTIISGIMLESSFFTSELSYDKFLPEFGTVVSLCKIILPYIHSTHQGVAPRFNLDIGIVAALNLVGSRCRSDALWKDAIDMLFMSNVREGIWDALAVAHKVKWLRSVELEGLTPGDFIPEEKRAVMTAINIDLYKRRMMVGATQKGKGGVVERKTLIEW